ncbi:MAG: GNAT family N-acetyltransferase [Rhodoferax sp.]
MKMDIAYLDAPDRTQWLSLARGYKDFYMTPTSEIEFDDAWRLLLKREQVFGIGAKVNGELAGFAHYLFHASAWAPAVCYLQDLFTAPEMRGKGVARALIEKVAEESRKRGASRFYWLTQANNVIARGLYEKLAKHNGFIRYDFPLA